MGRAGVRGPGRRDHVRGLLVSWGQRLQESLRQEKETKNNPERESPERGTGKWGAEGQREQGNSDAAPPPARACVCADTHTRRTSPPTAQSTSTLAPSPTSSVPGIPLSPCMPPFHIALGKHTLKLHSQTLARTLYGHTHTTHQAQALWLDWQAQFPSPALGLCWGTPTLASLSPPSRLWLQKLQAREKGRLGGPRKAACEGPRECEGRGRVR